ncbi:DUF883 family protein [Pseudosulfitobacter sp. DSM 107133]|jgi:ElaB/YqjD/DUF883 family membrane-anchored ribosome-binding protein|uniref:DUF883 family protein n=1 Tax=Pseudosulfitobacter sp. DSM 107133 TaxID=2883100 RepID=UPI000DF40192|nr:DUF883 family protein [Pseudosulfitobacter sp. DSM 107133]UOA28861.1 hypothetical protein DSM107133_03619 [Pseudosulfitobacter sp. DSM 107133]
MSNALASTKAKLHATDSSDVSAQIDVIRSDIAELTTLLGQLATDSKNEAASRVKQSAKDLKQSASDQATYARVRAVEAGEHAQELAEEYYGQAEDAVRKQPALAVGIAAGVGFLVGLMATRRS